MSTPTAAYLANVANLLDEAPRNDGGRVEINDEHAEDIASNLSKIALYIEQLEASSPATV